VHETVEQRWQTGRGRAQDKDRKVHYTWGRHEQDSTREPATQPVLQCNLCMATQQTRCLRSCALEEREKQCQSSETRLRRRRGCTEAVPSWWGPRAGRQGIAGERPGQSVAGRVLHPRRQYVLGLSAPCKPVFLRCLSPTSCRKASALESRRPYRCTAVDSGLDNPTTARTQPRYPTA
jgi:hypothetical protein